MSTTLRPRTWEEFIGQPRLKAKLSQHIKAANEREEQLDDIILIAPPGVGKTSIVELIAQEHGCPLTSIIMGQTKATMLQDIILTTEGILFLDEFHKLAKTDQEILLSVLLDRFVQMPYGREYIRLPLTIIIATTERDKVLRTIKERFKIVPEFDPYTNEDMTQILFNMSSRLDGCPIDLEMAKVLAPATAGMPRQAEMIVFCARDLGSPNANEILEFAGITPEGLTTLHMKYLAALRKNNGGIAGVEVLTSSLQLDKPSVVELERTLVTLDMIEYTKAGRCLKNNGNKALTKNKEMIR